MSFVCTVVLPAKAIVRVEPREFGSLTSAMIALVTIAPCLFQPINVSRRADSNRLPLLQLRVITQALQGLARMYNCQYLRRLLVSNLLCVAPYCVLGGLRVVTISPLYPRERRRPRLIPFGPHRAGLTSCDFPANGYPTASEACSPRVATGILQRQGITFYMYGTHTITDVSLGVRHALRSQDEEVLDAYGGQRVTVHGTFVAGYENGQIEGGPPLLMVTKVERA